MQRVIVSDTSCLILLSKLGKLTILKSLFGTITVTSAIAIEFNESLPDFIRIEDPADKKHLTILETFLDKGEASAIALAIENDDCLLIIDELKGRKEAQKIGLNYTGTLGIIILAKEKGLISSISEFIEQISQTNFRVSDALIKELKRKVNE